MPGELSLCGSGLFHEWNERSGFNILEMAHGTPRPQPSTQLPWAGGAPSSSWAPLLTPPRAAHPARSCHQGGQTVNGSVLLWAFCQGCRELCFPPVSISPPTSHSGPSNEHFTPHRKEEKQGTLCTPLVLCLLQMQFPSSKISHSFCFTLNKITLDFWWIARLKIHLEAFPWILTWE